MYTQVHLHSNSQKTDTKTYAIIIMISNPFRWCAEIPCKSTFVKNTCVVEKGRVSKNKRSLRRYLKRQKWSSFYRDEWMRRVRKIVKLKTRDVFPVIKNHAGFLSRPFLFLVKGPDWKGRTQVLRVRFERYGCTNSDKNWERCGVEWLGIVIVVFLIYMHLTF